MTWSNFNILNGVIAQGRKIAWLGKDNFVSGSSSVIAALINEAGMTLFHLLLIYFRTSAPLERATKWVMARHSMRTTHKLCWCRIGLLKRCSLMKHKVPVPPFGKPSCRYVQICSVFHRGMLHLFLYNRQQGQKWFCWRDYQGFWIFSFILPFYCICFPLAWSSQQWKLSAQGWAALCPSEAAECQEGQLSEKAVASYQTGYLKPASCNSFLPLLCLFPLPVLGVCFSGVFSCFSLSAQDQQPKSPLPICVCGRACYFLICFFKLVWIISAEVKRVLISSWDIFHLTSSHIQCPCLLCNFYFP